uniref:Lipid-binding serum glycoprotein C-terminal domain-containing protein n=1 Tax=Physcomitrium patens TaxID=3218 RepID=A0A7I4EBQ8_PHYPA
MGFTVLRVFLLSASISLLLLPGFSAKFEPSSNETAYDGRYSKFKIVVEETEAENIVLTGNASPDASVSGDDGDGGNVAGIMVTLSESGLTYAKEMLVNQLLEEITPLMLPDIKTHTDSPLGRVDMEISHIELSGANVSYSDVDLWKTGITVFAGDINARIRLHWYFKFMSMFVPFPLSDRGWADVEVNNMVAGVSFFLQAHNGTVRLTVVECGTGIDDLDIQLQGGASWLYQLFVYAFDEEIRAILEAAITKRIIASIAQLDNNLQLLPRYLPIDDVSAVDVTIVQDPLVSLTFLSVGVRGEFTSLSKPSNFTFPDHGLPPGLFCNDSTKMVTIALCDYVINSAAAVYYEAGYLEWIVDELPQESWLNTHFWRWLIPQLYKKYPNTDMALGFASSAPPTVQLKTDGVTANAVADLTLSVKTEGKSLPVACISLALSMDAIFNVVGNNITAEATLNDLTLEMNWSDIGNFPVNLLQDQALGLPTVRLFQETWFRHTPPRVHDLKQ